MKSQSKHEKSSEAKSLGREIQYSPLRLVGILSMIGFCTILLIIGTFTRIKVINCLRPIEALMHPSIFPTIQSVLELKAYFYVPQIPVVLFTTALLGTACSMTSVFIYILIGLLFIPVFGLGGGIDYVLEPTFGYILAFIPGVIAGGIMIKKDYRIRNLLKSSIAMVLIIHFLGFLYMIAVSIIIKHDNLSYINILFFIYDNCKNFAKIYMDIDSNISKKN